ncbi:MAG: DM13 domain-containing protein [Myxococcota bacterium]
MRISLFVAVFLLWAGTAVAAERTGTFKGVAKSAAGNARVDVSSVTLTDSFSTEEGPDLFVLLHKQRSPKSYAKGQYVNLGKLKQTTGKQSYSIPDTLSPDDYASVVIWCKKFDVTFAVAVLK